nr:MAG TPA: hypothetical protein [Caudoviricetes sp.]
MIEQARNLHVGDILLYKNKESRIITDITHEGVVWTFRTTDLAGENPRFDTYNASDPLKVWGTQEALF